MEDIALRLAGDNGTNNRSGSLTNIDHSQAHTPLADGNNGECPLIHGLARKYFLSSSLASSLCFPEPQASTTANPPLLLPHLTVMPTEILLEITKSLHPTAIVCLSLTCTVLQKFFRKPAAFMPALSTTVVCPPLNIERNLWELVENFMKPRLYVGHYGKEKFVNMEAYKVVRDEYWEKFPQRPWCIEEPSPWVGEGGGAVDVGGAAQELVAESSAGNENEGNEGDEGGAATRPTQVPGSYSPRLESIRGELQKELIRQRGMAALPVSGTDIPDGFANDENPEHQNDLQTSPPLLPLTPEEQTAFQGLAQHLAHDSMPGQRAVLRQLNGQQAAAQSIQDLPVIGSSLPGGFAGGDNLEDKNDDNDGGVDLFHGSTPRPSQSGGTRNSNALPQNGFQAFDVGSRNILYADNQYDAEDPDDEDDSQILHPPSRMI